MPAPDTPTDDVADHALPLDRPSTELAHLSRLYALGDASSVCFKIALTSEYDAWARSGHILGSSLDVSDGFVHASNAAMVVEVERMFFADNSNELVLLEMDPVKLAHFYSDVQITMADEAPTERPQTTEEKPRLHVVVHRLEDGCRHIHSSGENGCTLPLEIIERVWPLPKLEGGGRRWPTTKAFEHIAVSKE